ncbi:hypothetical protein MMC27_003119 [Xylographa pallens]|nr:hypothetical protein [Xylographa pallens]
MDLVAGVRKEGSRGGRGDFKWEDVKGNQHRENYLGHSLMAPVGRWQKNKDLGWYAKGDDDASLEAVERAARERREEIARIKLAEGDALREALGYAVEKRAGTGTGANAVLVAEGMEGVEMGMNARIGLGGGEEEGGGVEKKKKQQRGEGPRRDQRREREDGHRRHGHARREKEGSTRRRARSGSYERRREGVASTTQRGSVHRERSRDGHRDAGGAPARRERDRSYERRRETEAAPSRGERSGRRERETERDGSYERRRETEMAPVGNGRERERRRSRSRSPGRRGGGVGGGN